MLMCRPQRVTVHIYTGHEPKYSSSCGGDIQEVLTGDSPNTTTKGGRVRSHTGEQSPPGTMGTKWQ